MLTFGGKKHWLLIVDDCSDFIWSFFLEEKSNLVDIIIGSIKNLKHERNLQVHYLHCDNTQENITFQKACKQVGLGMTLNIQPQVCHNKMAALKESLLLYSTKYVLCLTAINSMLIFEMAYGPKLQRLPCFSKITFSL